MSADCRSLALSGADTTQATAFDRIVSDYFEYRLATFPALKELCAAAPDFAMAHVLKGCLLLSMGTRDTLPAARACVAHVAERRVALTAREAHHLAALEAWCRGDTAGACQHWDDALFVEPLDLLALKLQHFALFWRGRASHMRDAAQRVMPVWSESTPGYANLLGILAFALEETGDYVGAEAKGREAVERDPEDLWAIHAVAHVYEMQGRLDEGIAWLDQPYDRWDDRNPFKDHLWWHAAMFPYEKGRFERALELYDRVVRPDDSTFYLDLQNAVSLLARLEMAGVDVGERWEELAEASVSRQGDHVLVFTEPHYAMAYGRTARLEEAAQQMASLTAFAQDSDATAADLMEPLVVPLCEAIAAYYGGDYEAVIARMMPLRYDYQALGGSHAQRDIFALYLLDAAIKGGKVQLARALLRERLALHPNSYATRYHYDALRAQA